MKSFISKLREALIDNKSVNYIKEMSEQNNIRLSRTSIEFISKGDKTIDEKVFDLIDSSEAM